MNYNDWRDAQSNDWPWPPREGAAVLWHKRYLQVKTERDEARSWAHKYKRMYKRMYEDASKRLELALVAGEAQGNARKVAGGYGVPGEIKEAAQMLIDFCEEKELA